MTRIKYYLRILLTIPFVPFLLLKMYLFDTPDNLWYVARRIEEVFATKVFQIDIGDGTRTVPLEYFFYSTSSKNISVKLLRELTKALTISAKDIRLQQKDKGAVFVLSSSGMDKILLTCDRMPSRARQIANKFFK